MIAADTAPRDAAIAVGAAPHDDDWHTIDWYQAHRVVRRLQARIGQAPQEGRWGKVKALQHLLTHSFSGKALAVRRVTENQGHRTPGVDRVTWTTPDQKRQAVHSLRQRGYHPQPLRRISIPKSNGKMRPLSSATMQDRAMQALYLLALDPEASGFRPHRCGRRCWPGGDQWPGWLGSLEQRAHLSPVLLKQAALVGQGDLCWLVSISVRRAAGSDRLTLHADRHDAARPTRVRRQWIRCCPARSVQMPRPRAPAA